MILNRLDEESITDTVGVCCSRSINGYCYPSIGAYLRGRGKPHFPVPAMKIDWDYWPAEHTEIGKPVIYGFCHYKPGVWKEFLCVAAK